MKRLLLVGLLTSATFALGTGALNSYLLDPGFQRIDLHVEVDQATLAAELSLEVQSDPPLRSLALLDGSGKPVLGMRTAEVAQVGMGELKLEGHAESLSSLAALFPAGSYWVRGVTWQGVEVLHPVELSHGLPGRFVSTPTAGVLSRDAALLEWTGSVGATCYMLEVCLVDGGFEMEIELPAHVTRFVVPAAVLRVGGDYEYSLAAKGDTDNELEIEGVFRVIE